MPWKTDEDGVLQVRDGMPVYIDDKGEEAPFDVDQKMTRIARLNSENQRRRETEEETSTQLAALQKEYDGYDPETAKKNAEIVASLKDRKLLDAVMKGNGESSTFGPDELEAAKRDVKDGMQKLIDGRDETIAAKDAKIRQLTVSQRFSGSKWFAGEAPLTVLPPDIAESRFGAHFEPNGDGVIGYYDLEHKTPIYSQSDPGEPADFDEAVGALIETYPNKDHILRARNASGSNAPPTGTGKHGTGASKRSEMTDAEKSDYIKDHGIERFQQLSA